MDPNPHVTKLLDRLDSGDGKAAAELFPLVYDELKRLAKWKLADEQAGHTLQTTALVNEVYIRLVGTRTDLRFASRKGFLIAASDSMRHILVDVARRKLAQKRGGGIQRELLDIDRMLVNRPQELVDVHEALDALANRDASCAELVKLHYFGGYSLAEAADVLSISRSTANRWWLYAKAWLKDWIENESK